MGKVLKVEKLGKRQVAKMNNTARRMRASNVNVTNTRGGIRK